MELGNLMFGNSRGCYEIKRTTAWEDPWKELTEALKINWRGYPERECLVPVNEDGDVENGVFRIRAYDWDAECDCGFDDRVDAWWSANPHRENCYRNELDRRKIASGLYENSDGWVRVKDGVEWKVGDNITKALCRERGLSYPEGSAVHCDCGRNEEAEQTFAADGHSDSCRFVQPNFLFKPTGFRINWYKYPFRDSYASEKVSPSQWRKIVRDCIASAKPFP